MEHKNIYAEDKSNISVISYDLRPQFGTLYGIYEIEDGYIIHGESVVMRIDLDSNEVWEFTSDEIFTGFEDHPYCEVTDEEVIVYDFNEKRYVINYEGEEID